MASFDSSKSGGVSVRLSLGELQNAGAGTQWLSISVAAGSWTEDSTGRSRRPRMTCSELGKMVLHPLKKPAAVGTTTTTDKDDNDTDPERRQRHDRQDHYDPGRQTCDSQRPTPHR